MLVRNLQCGVNLVTEGDLIVHDKSTCTADIGVQKSAKPMKSPVELLQEIFASSSLSSATSVDDNSESGEFTSSSTKVYGF
jgi:hypothetical protein